VTPSEFGDYIFNIRRESGISRSTFSKKWAYHTNTIKSYEKGGRLPPVEYIAALSIETGENFIPLLGLLLSSGSLATTDYSKEIKSLTDVQQANAVYEGKVGYSAGETGLQHRVESDSMSPTIAKGAVITYETYEEANQIKDGSIVLLDIEQVLTLRRVQFLTDKQCILSCDNSHYSPITYDKGDFEKLTLVGIVKYTLNPV
jgi:phage repressor protein C with HTH and peptisase S24 domain